MTRLATDSPDHKLRELILYIATMCQRDERFGKTKLNKILFNIDFAAYRKFGKSISGQDYYAREFGPTPERMKQALDYLENKHDLAIDRKEYFGRQQERPIALRSADLSALTRDEINLVFETINFYWDRSGTDMSNESHEFLGWEVAGPEEKIPYTVALVGTREPTMDEIRRGYELASMAEECLARNAPGKTMDNR